MKTLFVLVLCVAGLGLYRGWLSITSKDNDAANNKLSISVEVDSDKMKEDAGKVKHLTTELANKIATETQVLADQAQGNVDSNDP